MGLYGAWLAKAGRLSGRSRGFGGSCGLLGQWQEANLKKVCGSFAHVRSEGGANYTDDRCLMRDAAYGYKTNCPPSPFPVISCSDAVEAMHERIGYKNLISTTEFSNMWKELFPSPQVTSSSPDLASEVVRQGIVLHCGDAVYLDGSKVAQLVENSLPSSRSVIDRRLKTLQEELAPMENANKEMVKEAYVGAKRILWMGLGGLILQFLVMFDLTYFVYSWNETEPVTYFLRYGLFIGAYVYLMRTNQALGHTSFYSWLGNKRLTKLRKECGFNSERYSYLKEEVKKWERYAKSSQSLRHLADKSLANICTSAILVPGSLMDPQRMNPSRKNK